MTEISEPFADWVFFLGADAWKKAMEEFDGGNVNWLADYIERGHPLSAEMLGVLGQIIRKQRNPDARKKKTGLSRLMRSEAIMDVEFLREEKAEVLAEDASMDDLADHLRIERQEAVAFVEERYREAIAELAKRYGVTSNTLLEMSKPSRNEK